MDKSSLPVAGGLSAAAILAFALNPWAGQNSTLANQPPTASPTVRSVSTNANGASVPAQARSENDLGPWYALCKVFSTIDPEDIETRPDHPLKPEGGLDTHPPLSADAESFSEEIKEETVTKGQVQRKFVPLYHYKAHLSSCLPQGSLSQNALDLSYIIATIPDPQESHLALQFDRNIVAIERAAEADGFGFERYWFPWSRILKTEENAHTNSASDALRQDLREQPGILIFRKFRKFDAYSPGIDATRAYSSRLVVFLVGETPTSGMNKVAFTKSVLYVNELKAALKPAPVSPCADSQRIKVIGPNFSGSFSSLYRALYDLRQIAPCVSANVWSTTPTVGPLMDIFDQELRTNSLGTFVPIAPHDSSVTAPMMIDYLRSLGYSHRDIVYLSEDETPYTPGVERTDHSSDDIPTLTYPRDLAALRNVWQPTSLSLTPADISGDVVKTQITPFSLHEEASNELDSPTAFATDQAAPDIDQALSSIITVIRHNRYRVVIVTATNPLDEVYLLQYIHHNAADVRLVTLDQDSLMLRATNYENLRGTISVTSFPLVSTRSLDPANAAEFPNSGAEVTYIGVRLALCSQPLSALEGPSCAAQHLSEKNQGQVLSYLRTNPGIYLLGNDTFWAVRQVPPPLLTPLRDTQPIIPWPWYVLVVTLTGLAIYHLYHFRKVYAPHRRAIKGRIVIRYYNSLGLSGSRHREDMVEDYFLLVGNNQLATLLCLVAFPTLLVYRNFVGSIQQTDVGDIERYAIFITKGGFLFLLVMMSLIVITASILLLLRLRNTISNVLAKMSSNENAILSQKDLTMVIIYPMATLAVWLFVLLSDPGNRSHTIFRIVCFFEGLSPLPLICAVISVWYLLAITGLRAARTMKVMRVDPLIAVSGDPDSIPEWNDAVGSAQRSLLEAVEAFVKPGPRGGLILWMGLVVLIGLQGWPAMRGVDSSVFRAWIFGGGVGLLSVAILVQFGRIWSIWSCLRVFLALLAAGPLASGFECVPDELSSVKVWRSLERRPSRALQRYTFELLGRIARRAPQHVQLSLEPYVDSATSLVNNLLYKLPRSEDVQVSDHLLLNACFDGLMSIVNQNGQNWFKERCEYGDTLVINYGALRYVALIKYVNAQIRWLLAFVLYGYMLLIFGCRTYPFQGQHTITSILTIMFTIIFSSAAVMFIQMDSNPLLSKLERSTPGKANYFEAGVHLLSVGGIPLIAVLASQFPVVEQFLLSWVKPTLESLH